MLFKHPGNSATFKQLHDAVEQGVFSMHNLDVGADLLRLGVGGSAATGTTKVKLNMRSVAVEALTLSQPCGGGGGIFGAPTTPDLFGTPAAAAGGTGAGAGGSSSSLSPTRRNYSTHMPATTGFNKGIVLDHSLVESDPLTDWRGHVALQRETPSYLLARSVIKNALDLTRHLSHATAVADSAWMPDGEALALLLGTSDRSKQQQQLEMLAKGASKSLSLFCFSSLFFLLFSSLLDGVGVDAATAAADVWWPLSNLWLCFGVV